MRSVRCCIAIPSEKNLPCGEGCLSNCTACDYFDVKIVKTFLVKRLVLRCAHRDFLNELSPRERMFLSRRPAGVPLRQLGVMPQSTFQIGFLWVCWAEM